MKFFSHKPYFFNSLLFITVLFLIIGAYVFGWTTPSTTPPSANRPVSLLPNSQNQSKLGYLSIGTTTLPSFPLDVFGVLRIGSFPSAPSGSPGALYYDTTSNKFKGYINSGWSDLGGSSLWTLSGNDVYYTAGNVGIGTSTPTAKLDIAPYTSTAGLEIVICYNNVCCPIWKDCDGDGKTYGNGDCDESCSTCYVGSTAYTPSPDGKDQDCDGVVDESASYCTTCNYNLGSVTTFGYYTGCNFGPFCSYKYFNGVYEGIPSNTASCSCSGSSCTYSGYANCAIAPLVGKTLSGSSISCNGSNYYTNTSTGISKIYYWQCQPVTSCSVTSSETRYQ